MTEFGRVEETHTHEIRTTPLVRGMALWLVILTVAIAVLGFYLIGRRTATDRRDQREHTAICALLDEVPNFGHPFIDQARTAFDCVR